MGASLLAMAVGQSILMLNVMASSRASSLPQGIFGVWENGTGMKKGGRMGLPLSLRSAVTNWQSAHAARPACPGPVRPRPVWRVLSR
ncbi:hypothetical protein C1X61_24515 [Pseudomonas sp. FW215-T2]|nr:hypothetical protein C1X61_24515 [Pseudomonas sp. FW215-T2]PNA08496.1 hypothetical protein C1X62_24765 [Pseudomonas sp. FW215-R3]PNB34737.1 hypothetical protein C1X63_25755 [Pseudomonas sp. FW305-131]